MWRLVALAWFLPPALLTGCSGTASVPAPPAFHGGSLAAPDAPQRRLEYLFLEDPLVGVLTYGRPSGLGWGGSGRSAKAGGQVLSIPAGEECVYALGPDRQFHRLPLTAAEAQEVLALCRSGRLLASDLWRERLGALVRPHAWPDDPT
jgi:hypothetical protein